MQRLTCRVSVNYCDGLGRCFRFVCICACTSVFLCCYRFSVNKDLYKDDESQERGIFAIQLNALYRVILTKWPSCRDHMLCDVSSPHVYKSAIDIDVDIDMHRSNWAAVREYRSPLWTAALHVLRTDWAQSVLVSLQPISTKHSRDADAPCS